MIYRIQAEKESEIKNKIVQITIERKKLKLLTHSAATTAPIPKNTAVKLPPQKPSTVSVTTLSQQSKQQQPQQQQKMKPNAPIPIQSIPAPAPNGTNAPENEQKIECTKDDVPSNEIDKTVKCKPDSASDQQQQIDDRQAMQTVISKNFTNCVRSQRI